MADGREDQRVTSQFIEEIQNCPDLWGVSSAAYKDTKKQKNVEIKRVLWFDASLTSERISLPTF